MQHFKKICYRGGIAKFDIPFSWKEECEPSGGATFYDDKPDSGTFRLSVLGFSSNGKESSSVMVASMIAKNGFAKLHDGLAIKKYVKFANERGEQLQIHYWEVAIPVKPCSVRLAVFSYTILATQSKDRSVQNEIEMLENSIRSAEFSKENGISGDFYDQG